MINGKNERRKRIHLPPDESSRGKDYSYRVWDDFPGRRKGHLLCGWHGRYDIPRIIITLPILEGTFLSIPDRNIGLRATDTLHGSRFHFQIVTSEAKLEIYKLEDW